MNLSRLFLGWESNKVRKIYIVFLTLILFLIWIAVFNWPNGKLEIYFLDVGQGDSIFIKTPSNYQILVDGGPNDLVLSRLGEIIPFYDRSLDLVILTHPHADHVSGLLEVLSAYSVKKIISLDWVFDSGLYSSWEEKIGSLPKGSVLDCHQGQGLFLNDGVSLSCLWPESYNCNPVSGDINDCSLVLEVSFHDFQVLLTGDAEFSRVNIDYRSISPNLEVLKVPHQGSSGALSSEILDWLKPQLAIIPVGENHFGHPAGQEINLLKEKGINVLRTDLHGTVKIETDGQEWYYQTRD